MQELITLRKELHRYPELSGFEKETAKRVENFLRKYSPDELITNVGGYGIIAVYNGESDGHTILFRADMDALPIQEANEFEYKSVFENVFRMSVITLPDAAIKHESAVDRIAEK